VGQERLGEGSEDVPGLASRERPGEERPHEHEGGEVDLLPAHRHRGPRGLSRHGHREHRVRAGRIRDGASHVGSQGGSHGLRVGYQQARQPLLEEVRRDAGRDGVVQ